MKILLTLFFFHTQANAHIPMKTGFQSTRLTNQELTEHIRTLPLTKKDQLVHRQLQELIDPFIFENVAFEHLNKIRFSIKDSLQTLSRRYERLALHLQSLPLTHWVSESQRALILAHCYSLSADYLSRTLSDNIDFSAIDPHISIAQLIRWSARLTLMADPTAWERHSSLLLLAFNHLQTASSLIQNLNLTDIDQLIQNIDSQNQNILETLTDDDLKNIDPHALTVIRYSTSQAWEKVFIQKKLDLAKQNLLEKGIHNNLINKTLDQYQTMIENRLQKKQSPTRTALTQELLQKRPTELYSLLHQNGFIDQGDYHILKLDKVLQEIPINHVTDTTWGQKIRRHVLGYTKKIDSEKYILANLFTQLNDIKKMTDEEKWTLQIYYDTPTLLRFIK
ncbi:MAG: hypothetical protein AB8C84_05580 [Oligoflexales bacterium]